MQTNRALTVTATAANDVPRSTKATSRPTEAEPRPGGNGVSAGPSGAGAGTPGGKGGAKPLAEWSQLSLGCLVLAEDEDECGYFPAKIIATKANDHVVLAWHGYPDLLEFSRPRWALALLHPEAAARVLTP